MRTFNCNLRTTLISIFALLFLAFAQAAVRAGGVIFSISTVTRASAT